MSDATHSPAENEVPLVYPEHPVLLMDDEEPIMRGYRACLKCAGITNVICLTDSREAINVIKTRTLSAALMDLQMPFVSGEELLNEMAMHQPGVPVVVVTGTETIDSVVRCVKHGAYDYIVKPVPPERVVLSVRNALQVTDLTAGIRVLGDKILSRQLKHPEFFAEIFTNDAAMLSMFSYIEAVAITGNPVLLTGETGVGKELVARSIHRASGRSGSFVAVNIAGLDDTMFSDTLFGHTRGAFTGADAPRKGLISQAHQGTLFLDEIGDLTVVSQVKLLRLLQEQEYTPLGQDGAIKTDARIVVATNADLTRLQDAGRFRPDLFYRLSTHKIRISPLRCRYGDLEMLVDHFLQSAAQRLNRKKPTAPRELISLLSTYTFPGNVRELESMITDAVTRHTSHMLSLQAFKEHIGDGNRATPAAPGAATRISFPGNTTDVFVGSLPTFDDVKRLLVEEALRRTNGNRTLAAALLKTSRQTLSWVLRTADSGGKNQNRDADDLLLA